MNTNFQTVVNWIESKVGPVGSGDVTSSNVTITGTVSVPPGSFTGTEISDGTIGGDDIRDGSVSVADLDPSVAGTGLTASGSSINLDPSWIRVSSEFQMSLNFAVSAGPLDQTIDTGIPTTNGICFLTRVDTPDDDDEYDQMDCWVYPESGTWILHGYSDDKDNVGIIAACAARCLQWG